MANFRPLYSIESEQSVIGGLLLDPQAIDRIGALRPEHFYDQAHRLIFGQILRMIAEGRMVDTVTVADELDIAGQSEMGGLAYLGELAANTPGASNLHRYAEIVVNRAKVRQLLAASETIRDLALGLGDTPEKLNAAQAAVMSITESSAPKAPRSLREVLLSAVSVLERRSNGGEQRLPTGLCDLDERLSGGMAPGNVIVVAGRPAMGKTVLGVQIAAHVARSGIPALLLSQEMTDQEVADRLLSLTGRVPLNFVLSGQLEGDYGDRMYEAVAALNDVPLIIDDQGGLSMFEVAAKARSVKRKHGLGLLVVDYLQLMTGEGDNRNAQIEQISRGLKALAKELDIPVVALSQLSRKCEERSNRRPMLSDLRDSGAVEQDADVVIFIYRDEVYHPESRDAGTAELLIAKNRQGSTATVRATFIGEQVRFENLAHDWQPAVKEKQHTFARKKRGFDG